MTGDPPSPLETAWQAAVAYKCTLSPLPQNERAHMPVTGCVARRSRGTLRGRLSACVSSLAILCTRSPVAVKQEIGLWLDILRRSKGLCKARISLEGEANGPAKRRSEHRNPKQEPGVTSGLVWETVAPEIWWYRKCNPSSWARQVIYRGNSCLLGWGWGVGIRSDGWRHRSHCLRDAWPSVRGWAALPMLKSKPPVCRAAPQPTVLLTDRLSINPIFVSSAYEWPYIGRI